MSKIHPSFYFPPPRTWAPQPGAAVRLMYQDKIYDGEITQVLEEPRAYVITSDDLLLPVVCSRNSLRPLD